MTLKIAEKTNITEQIFQYLLCFLIIGFAGSMWFEELQYPLLILAWASFMVVFMLNFNESNLRVILMMFALFVPLIVVRMFVGGLAIKNWILVTGQLLIAFAAVSLNAEKIVQRYVEVALAVCVVSLVCFMFQTVYPDILEKVLRPTSYMKWTYYGKWLYVYRPNLIPIEGNRNNGMFTEPGRYQVVITAALYFVLFMRDKLSFSDRKTIAAALILILTIATTGSTTGYLGCLILLVFFILKNDRSNESLRVSLTAIMMIGSLVLLGDYLINADDSLVGKFVIAKFANTDASSVESSGGARLRMIEVSLNVMKAHPMGAGYENIEGMVTMINSTGAGLLRFAAAWGPLPIMLLFIAIFKNVFFERGFLEGICFVLIYINTGLAQAYAIQSPFILISAYCYYNYRKKLYGPGADTTPEKGNLR